MEELYTIALQLVPRVGRKTIQKIYLDNIGVRKNEDFYRNNLLFFINQNDKENTIDFYLEKAQRILDQSLKENINTISVFNKSFPNNFKSIEDFPVIIYYKGNKDLLYNINNLAIIGTREPTTHGINATMRLTEIAVSKNYTIVSGLAKGCDTCAHQATLDNNGYTVAVMPGGLDSIYPKSNTDLAQRILENGGCLVSEYNVGTKPFLGHYVERDRLQTALSRGIIVIETRLDGGSMHAINHGLETDRVIGAYNNLAYYTGEKLDNIQGNLDLINRKKAISLENKENVELFFKKLGERDIVNLVESNVQLNIFD